MVRRFSLLVFGLVFAQSAWAAPKAPISLAKTGEWEVYNDTGACHLWGSFGTGSQEIAVRLSRAGSEDSYQIALLGKILATQSSQLPLEIDFGLGRPLKVLAQAGKADGVRPLLLLGSMRLDGRSRASFQKPLAPVSKEQEAQITAINLHLPGARLYRLETGSITTPLADMAQCVNDLVRSWGFDPVEQTTLSQPALPLGSEDSWIKSKDYPKGSLDRKENGFVQFRLNIGQDGSVEQCHISQRTNPDSFADLVCKLATERMKFRPALDSHGKPVRSFYVNSVRWFAFGRSE